MRRMPFLILLAAAGAWLCAADLAAAQRTFVSAVSGSDANPCSRALPCRNFAAAIPQTDPDGEVIVLDSGGYGGVNITQPVSLISPSGVYAGIFALGGTAVTVNAGDTAHVVLRNLSLNTGVNGVIANTVAALYVENCVVSGFSVNGIVFAPTTSGARLYVSDTTVRRSGAGIRLVGSSVRVTIDSVWLHENTRAVYVSGAEATIRESLASGGVGQGFYAIDNSKVFIESTISTGKGVGFQADDGSKMILNRCAASSNSNIGVYAFGAGGKVYVSDSTIVLNATGVLGTSGGVITSRGNNTVQANTTNGVFNSTFNPD